MTKEHSTIGSRLKNWLKKNNRFFGTEPENKKELIEVLRESKTRDLMDNEGLSMMEGVLQVAEMRVRDIMIPRANMAVIQRDASLDEIIKIVNDSQHSRYPVIGDDKGEVVGLLLAKDLLSYCNSEKANAFDVRDLIRNAVYVPESKRLNVMLKDFKSGRTHMAIVVDEYGAAAGVVTIEDVLEQIVGEIEDEHDYEDGLSIFQQNDHEFTLKASTSIEEFNEYFKVEFDDSEFDTIAGLVIRAFGHMPSKEESVDIDQFHFKILRADSRRVYLLKMTIIHKGDESESSD